MNLYLTRHGETKWNIEGRMQGRKNSDLTEKGIRQAEALRRSLESVKFDKIYSSPSERALITAKMLAGDGLEVIIEERLMEINMGGWEGVKISDVKDTYPELYKCYWETPHLFNVSGMETFAEVIDRAAAVISDIVRGGGENVLVVSHGVTLKAIMCIWEKRTAEAFWDGGFFKQTAIGIVKCDEQLNGEIIKCYDTSHLSDEEESAFLWRVR